MMNRATIKVIKMINLKSVITSAITAEARIIEGMTHLKLEIARDVLMTYLLDLK